MKPSNLEADFRHALRIAFFDLPATERTRHRIRSRFGDPTRHGAPRRPPVRHKGRWRRMEWIEWERETRGMLR
jgi:hypothetical protein